LFFHDHDRWRAVIERRDGGVAVHAKAGWRRHLKHLIPGDEMKTN